MRLHVDQVPREEYPSLEMDPDDIPFRVTGLEDLAYLLIANSESMLPATLAGTDKIRPNATSALVVIADIDEFQARELGELFVSQCSHPEAFLIMNPGDKVEAKPVW